MRDTEREREIHRDRERERERDTERMRGRDTERMREIQKLRTVWPWPESKLASSAKIYRLPHSYLDVKTSITNQVYTSSQQSQWCDTVCQCKPGQIKIIIMTSKGTI